jgi:hypothetical protein
MQDIPQEECQQEANMEGRGGDENFEDKPRLSHIQIPM